MPPGEMFEPASRRLAAAERLLLACSHYDRVPVEKLEPLVQAVTPEAWPLIVRRMDRHGLPGNLWYHLRPLRAVLPRAVADAAERSHRRAVAADLRCGRLVETLADAFRARGNMVLFAKGVPMHRWLYGERDLPRGSGDVDVLVGNGHEGMLAARETLRTLGFAPVSPIPFHLEWHTRHDFSYRRKTARDDVSIELQRAPSDFQLTDDTLLRWLFAQGSELPWRTDGHRITSLSGLGATGSLVFLSIHLLKEGIPRLRYVNDLAALLENHADAIDWEAVRSLEQRAGMRGVVTLALRHVARLRNVRAREKATPLKWHQRGASHLTGIRALVRFPVDKLDAPEEHFQVCFFNFLHFGWRSVWNEHRRWRAFHRANEGAQVPNAHHSFLGRAGAAASLMPGYVAGLARRFRPSDEL